MGLSAIIATLFVFAFPALLSAQLHTDAKLCDQMQGRAEAAAQARTSARALITSRAGSPSAAFLNGCISVADGKPDKAAEFFEAAAQGEPRSLYYDWLGRAYGDQARSANKLRQPVLARKTRNAFEKAVSLDPDNLDARYTLMLYYQAAPGIMGGSDEKARQQISEIRARNPYRGAIANAGYLLNEKDLAGAERESAGLTKSYPDSSAGWISLMQVQATAEKWSEAFGTADAMRSVTGKGALSDYWIGRLAAISGQQLERGEAAMRRYLRSTPGPNEPSVASAHFRLGQILVAKKENAAARSEFQEALRLQPNHQEAKKSLAILK